MLKRKNYIGEKFPWMYRLKGTCYYSWMCPTEMNHIERKRSLVMWLFFGKKNDRYVRSGATMFWKKRYIGEKFPWMYRLKGTCYYSRRCPVEMDHIEKKWSLSMWLVFGKKNDRYI